MPVTTAPREPSSERVPGRVWTIRLTGHADRTISVTCSTTACRMPPRSRDLAVLRSFATHAKVATVHAHAWRHCGTSQCDAHPDVRVHCAGGVALVLQHDPLIGRLWKLQEVCDACALLIPHARVLARAVRPPRARRTEEEQTAPRMPSSAQPGVPGGFSSPGLPAEGPSRQPRRPRRAPRPVQRRSQEPGR